MPLVSRPMTSASRSSSLSSVARTSTLCVHIFTCKVIQVLTLSFMQLIAEGSAKLSSVPSGGAAAASSGAATGGGSAGPTEEVEEKKKEEEKVRVLFPFARY